MPVCYLRTINGPYRARLDGPFRRAKNVPSQMRRPINWGSWGLKVQQTLARCTGLRVSSPEFLLQIALLVKSHHFGKCSDLRFLYIIRCNIILWSSHDPPRTSNPSGLTPMTRFVHLGPRSLLAVLLIQLQYFSCFSPIFNDHSNNVNYRPTVLIAMTRQSQSIGLVAMENHQASVMQVEATFTTVMFRVPLANSAAVLASWTRMCT